MNGWDTRSPPAPSPPAPFVPPAAPTASSSSASSPQSQRRNSQATTAATSVTDERRPSTASKKGGGTKGRARQVEDEGDEDDDERAAKKGRLVLSCGECKRRKVKCDRKIPCSACIRRGQPEACAWDPHGSIIPENQPFALTTQFETLASRLEEIELFLQTLPPEIRAGAPKPTLPLDALPIPLERPRVQGSNADRAGVTSEMEKAVLQLENSTFHSGEDDNGPKTTADFLVTPVTYAAPPPASVIEHPEPTSELTSILAPPLRYTGPASAIALGLDFCTTEEDMRDQYETALTKLFAVFPSRDVASLLVEKYINDFAWFYHILHAPALIAEHARLWDMIRAGRGREVDPSFLAIYFMVIALGVTSAHTVSPSALPCSSREETAQTWYAAALRLFQLADWTRRPQFRIVQLVLLLGQWNITAAPADHATSFVSYLAAGVRVAQKLRLHLLGDDAATMPPDDPAFPPGQNSVKRQTALRVFGLLSFLDTVAANGRLAAYLVHPEQVTSSPLANLNTAQLSKTEWRINPAPRSVWTESSLEYAKWRGGVYMKRVFDCLVTRGSEFSYDETVMSLDREIRALIDDFPDAMASENARMEAANPVLRKQRFFSLSGVNSRLLRLHRPFVLLGYTNSRYRYSTDLALKASRAVITAHHNGRDMLANIRIVYSHTLSAAIVIGSNLFYLIDSDASSSEIESDIDMLTMSHEIFDPSKVLSPKLTPVLEHGRQIISMLLTAADQRREQRLANGGSFQNVPTFTQALREIAKHLHLVQSPAATLSPPNGAAASFATPAGQFSSFPVTPAPVPMAPLAPPSHPPPLPSYPSYPSAIPAPLPQNGNAHVAPAYAAQFLSDLGLTSAGTSAGAFDTSWYAPQQQPPPPPPPSNGYHQQQQLYTDPGMAPPAPAPAYQYEAVQHPQQYGGQPVWAADGSAAARALLEQIGGP
ncbi:hypothetical protein JCM6882_004755 [Rhodosporidiobolus microsporus]